MTKSDAGKGPGDTKKLLVELVLLIIAWYAASSLAVATSKQLVKEMDSMVMTALQMIISVPCGALVLICQGAASDLTLPDTPGLRTSLFGVTCAFAVGFVTLNMSYAFLSIPLAMALRAAEPLVAVVVSFFYTYNVPSLEVVFSLLVIVGGVVMCTFASGELSAVGVALVLVANLGFAVRSVVGKRVQALAQFKSKGIALFFHICVQAAALQSTLAVLKFLYVGNSLAVHLPDSDFCMRILVNGVCYFMYLAFSFLILARVAPVTHTVLNAMRRPFTIVMSSFYLQTTLSTQVCIGIAISCVGSALYSKAKMAEAPKKTR